MGVAKVVLNGDTLIDTTGKTVAADKMLAPYTALDKAGNNVTGNIAAKSSSDLTVSGATVTAPAGFYASAASKSVSSMALPTSASTTSSGTSKATISRSTSDQYINIPTGYNSTASYYKISAVANGTAGTPTATKGTVSNHQVSITPSVTNTTGYITGGTKTGTAVTVTASELASGSKSISANGTGIDVVGYSTVDVAVPSDDFIVTVSWNSSTSRYEPNKTFSEIQAAYNAGKTIVVVSDEQSADTAVDGEYHTGTNQYFEYWVRKYLDGQSPQTIREIGYRLSSTEIDTIDNLDYIRPTGTINISQSGNTDVTNYATANVPAGSATVPASISGTSATVSTGTNTLTLSKTVSVTPSVSAGYVSSGTAGNSAVSLTASVTTKAATTITPSTSQQTAVAAGTYCTGAITVSAMPSMTLPTAASSTASGTSKATITPSTSAQYINIPTGYNGTASYYKINAMTTMTLPTAASSSSSGTSKATISRSTSAQYINIPIGYNSTASYYAISATPNMTLPTSASSTSSGTSKATIGRSTSNQYINIPTGYNSTASYYTISATPNMTLPTAASSTSSGTSKATITPSSSAQYINIPTGYNGTASYYKINAAGASSTNTATIIGTAQDPDSTFVETLDGFFYQNGQTFTWTGNTYEISINSYGGTGGDIYVNGVYVATEEYYMSLPNCDVIVTFVNVGTNIDNIYIDYTPTSATCEMGIYVPTADIATPTISFRNTHTDPPMYIAFEDVSSSVYASDASANTNMWWIFIKYAYVSPTEIGVAATSTQTHYGIVRYGYRGTTAGGNLTAGGANLYYPNSETSAGSNTYPRYWATSTVFKPSSASSTRYWRAGHTFKWIAIWPPET